MSYLFVYGTLRSDITSILEELVHDQIIYKGKGKAFGFKIVKMRKYPGIMIDESRERFVIGEVYRLLDAKKVIHILDSYERCNRIKSRSSYIRIKATICIRNRKLIAWVYSCKNSIRRYTDIKFNDYKAYMRAKAI